MQQDSYVSAAIAKGFKVVKLDTMVDAGFINHMEQKWENVMFTRVDADIPDNLVDHGETTARERAEPKSRKGN